MARGFCPVVSRWPVTVRTGLLSLARPPVTVCVVFGRNWPGRGYFASPDERDAPFALLARCSAGMPAAGVVGKNEVEGTPGSRLATRSACCSGRVTSLSGEDDIHDPHFMSTASLADCSL